MSKAPNALEAVARVRRVREQDSLIGLQEARREAQERKSVVDSLKDRIEAAERLVVTDSRWFAQRRTSLIHLAETLATAQVELEASMNIAVAARERWQQDKAALRSIEMLQERRKQEARAEVARMEARTLDDIAAQLWQRRNGAC